MKWETLATGQPRHDSGDRYSESISALYKSLVQVKKLQRHSGESAATNWYLEHRPANRVGGPTTTVYGTQWRWQSGHARNCRSAELHSNIGSTNADTEQTN
jgi:hypothetical protein